MRTARKPARRKTSKAKTPADEIDLNPLTPSARENTARGTARVLAGVLADLLEEMPEMDLESEVLRMVRSRLFAIDPKPNIPATNGVALRAAADLMDILDYDQFLSDGRKLLAYDLADPRTLFPGACKPTD